MKQIIIRPHRARQRRRDNDSFQGCPVTGGTGTFTGATGTITAKPANTPGTHSAVTISYTI
jgi:hypothetical protein